MDSTPVGLSLDENVLRRRPHRLYQQSQPLPAQPRPADVKYNSNRFQELHKLVLKALSWVLCNFENISDCSKRFYAVSPCIDYLLSPISGLAC